MLQALSLEYSTLRQELTTLMATRYQTLTVLGAAAALVLGFARDKGNLVPERAVVAIGSALFLLGLVTWLHAGRRVGTLSKRIAQLEEDINAVASIGTGSGLKLMRWEKDHQSRRGLDRLFLGPGTTPEKNRLKLR
jgi:hypothetical protein